MFWVLLFSCIHHPRRKYVRLNEPVLAHKICEHSNRMRTTNNQTSLVIDDILTATAQKYARVLRKGRFFSHIQDNNKKERTPRDRVRYAGGVDTTTAENLAKISALQLPVKKIQVQVVSHKKSHYRKPDETTLIPHHTNETAAKATVDSWMNSKEHRENLLFPNMTHVGCGVSLMFAQNKAPMIVAVQILQSQ